MPPSGQVDVQVKKSPGLLLSLYSVFLLLGIGFAVSVTDSEPPADEATYVGWQTCTEAGCHADKSGNFPGADEFRKTMHANIHNRPTPENVVIDRWFDNDTTLYVIDEKARDSANNTLFIDLSKQGSKDRYFMRLRIEGDYADTLGWLNIAYNYGGNGWLQRFLVEYDGSYYPTPFQYVLKTYRDTESDDGVVVFLDVYRWYYVDRELSAIFFFEKGSDTLQELSWDHDCSACHVNGFELEHIVVNDTFDTWKAKWAGSEEADSASRDINIAVGCESCHGPGSNHAADPTNSEFQVAISPKLWDLSDESRYWTDRKLDLCNQCHNRHRSTKNIHRYQYDDSNETPYLPRLELNDFIRDPLKDAEFWNDGKTSKAHHQQGQDYWRSGHYRAQVFSGGCFDCHKPHNNTEYPYQLDRNWYSLKKGVGCVAFNCHETYADTVEREGEIFNVHSKHLNQHSQCVNCHYTKSATIAFAGQNEFSDHSDNVVRPTATIWFARNGPNFLGALNTCAASCHRNGYGERNRPDAVDRNASIRYSMGEDVVPMRAPDFGIEDQYISIWNNAADIELADSLWLRYQEMYAEYMFVREGTSRSTNSAISTISPNPATASAAIRFDLATSQRVRLSVYDNRGKLVRILSEGRLDAGSYRAEWTLIDEFNRDVPSGAYMVYLTGETFSSSRLLIVQR